MGEEMDHQRLIGRLRALAATCAFALAMLVAQTAMATPLASANRTPPNVETAAQRLNVTPERDFDHAWSSSGDLTEKCRAAAQNLLNLYRYVAGVGEVGFTATYNAETQAAAKVMTLTGKASHDLTEQPAGVTDGEWALAKRGAASSNIFNPGTRGVDHVLKVFMEDPGVQNENVMGHRRWMTSPRTLASGYGASKGMTALSAKDENPLRLAIVFRP